MRTPRGGRIAMGEYLLGIDAGTTMIKAALVDRNGSQVVTTGAKVPLHMHRNRYVERNMHEVWDVTARTVQDCLVDANATGRHVAAVGVTGHGDGFYAVDEQLRPVREAIVALDSRAHGLIRQWRERPLWSLRLTGQVPFAGSSPALLAWLRRHDPTALEGSKWLLFCKDWIKLGLTGEISTDVTDASALFVDPRHRGYSQEALDAYGLGDLGEKLPTILPSDSAAGTVSQAAAERTGLAAGTPVVAGAHDAHAAALGMGAIRPGTLSLICGTFSINQFLSDHLELDPRWAARGSITAGHWMNMSVSPTSAINIEWFLNAFEARGEAATRMLDEVNKEVAKRLAEPSEVLYLPYVYDAPFGEHGGGAFLGLHARHDRVDLMRAIMEGVVFNHRRHVDALRAGFPVTSSARLSGGAARSDVWAQMFADALGIEMQRPDAEETGARGAALLAGVAVGAFSTASEAASVPVVARRYTPDPDRVAMLDDLYHRFLDTTKRLEPLWERLE
jgi:L-xylulokinase